MIKTILQLLFFRVSRCVLGIALNGAPALTGMLIRYSYINTLKKYYHKNTLEQYDDNTNIIRLRYYIGR